MVSTVAARADHTDHTDHSAWAGLLEYGQPGWEPARADHTDHTDHTAPGDSWSMVTGQPKVHPRADRDHTPGAPPRHYGQYGRYGRVCAAHSTILQEPAQALWSVWSVWSRLRGPLDHTPGAPPGQYGQYGQYGRPPLHSTFRAHAKPLSYPRSASPKGKVRACPAGDGGGYSAAFSARGARAFRASCGAYGSNTTSSLPARYWATRRST
jgi:hypothetical protein